MKSTINYLDDAKAKLGITSDNAIAKWIGVTRAAVSSYRNGGRIIDDYTAAKIAVVLEIDPMVIIAAANAEREKEGERREFWENFYKRLGGIAASIIFAIVTFFVTLGNSTPSEAASILNIEKTFVINIHYAKYKNGSGSAATRFLNYFSSSSPPYKITRFSAISRPAMMPGFL